MYPPRRWRADPAPGLPRPHLGGTESRPQTGAHSAHFARPGPDDAGDELKATLSRVHAECLDFLGLPPVPDARGFDTVYQAPPTAEDWNPWRSARLLRFFLSTAWFWQAAVWSRLTPPAPEVMPLSPAAAGESDHRPLRVENAS